MKAVRTVGNPDWPCEDSGRNNQDILGRSQSSRGSFAEDIPILINTPSINLVPVVRSEDSRIMRNLGEYSRYATSGATPLLQNCVRVNSLERFGSFVRKTLEFQAWSNTAATGLCTGQFVRKVRES